MDGNKKEMPGSRSANIDEILRERERLDRVIQEEFKKKVSILFTDICDYTQYMDIRGDISGRALLQRHNDIVFSSVESNNGTVIKTIGDAVMASFSDELDAVKASVAIQEGLFEHNEKREPADEIHVRIGINSGKALLDGEDIFGDVVNVASRIQSEAGKDQILISETVYEQVRGSEDILCRYHEKVTVKGKPEPLILYRVVWQEEKPGVDIQTEAPAYEDKIRGTGKGGQPVKVLYLEASREGDKIKIGAHERMTGEESTIRHYEEMDVPMDRIKTQCRNIVELLNSANRKGRVRMDIFTKIRETGQVFYDELLTPEIKKKIKDTDAEYLTLNLDDQLVQIPWELLNDGHGFLCHKFNIGRLVRTRQQTWMTKQRNLGRPLKMLVLADPKGNLKGAYAEGEKIRDTMDSKTDFANVSFRTANITAGFIQEKIRNFDIVHFAGHAEYDPETPEEGGWLLSDGRLTARDIMKMSGSACMPALIFSNACQSARTEEWVLKDQFQNEIFGLANAFLLTGAKHYVGTFWEILDEPSSQFAVTFYSHIMGGLSIGEAMRTARMKLIESYGEETIVWGSYVLYGDPTFNYMDRIQEIEIPDKEPQKTLSQEGDDGIRAREEAITFGEKGTRKVSKVRWWAAAAITLVAVLLFGYPGFLNKGTGENERSAIASFQAGNYPEAVKACETIRDKNPKRRLSYLILGNIRFMEGDLKKAESLFQSALNSEQGTEEQKAEALLGLGRITSIQKKTKEALAYYRQAAELTPETGRAYSSQAILLGNQGKYDQALSLFKKARELSPDDRGLKALANETHEKASVSRDQEKQKKIDSLVQELLKNFEKSSTPPPRDGWTSLPLTLWMMDFETRGNSLQEGKEQIIASGIMDQLIEKSRAQVVERTLLDKLMEELKLSTTKLIDRSTALSLGRIMAARLILSGQVHLSGPQTQIAIRLIETETGQVRAAVNEAFGSAVPPSIIAEKLSGILLPKLKTHYPLRGKISGLEDKEISLNIGQKQGVKIGQKFTVKEIEGVLEITGVQSEVSIAKVNKGDEGIQPGLRVEALDE